jgi:hypothetical protein
MICLLSSELVLGRKEVWKEGGNQIESELKGDGGRKKYVDSSDTRSLT